MILKQDPKITHIINIVKELYNDIFSNNETTFLALMWCAKCNNRPLTLVISLLLVGAHTHVHVSYTENKATYPETFSLQESSSFLFWTFLGLLT